MEFYLGLLQILGVHTLLGLSAYVVLLTGQVSMAQAGFYAVGAYVAAMCTAMFGIHILPAVIIASVSTGILAMIVGFPALRVRGLMLVVATLAFGEMVRMFFFNFRWQIERDGKLIGPNGAEGFRAIRFFPENGWETGDVALVIWCIVVLVLGLLWWVDNTRAGAVLRAVGHDEVAAQSVGLNLTTIKVAAMALGGAIAGIGGGLYAHTVTHIEHGVFGILLATFAIAYPILGGLGSVFGTLLAVIFIQGFLVEGLRFIGDWRSLLFGALILLVMNLRPTGLLGERMSPLKTLFSRKSPVVTNAKETQ